MRPFRTALAAFGPTLALLAAAPAAADEGRLVDLAPIFARATAQQDTVAFEIDLGRGLAVPVEAETTNQGNGTLAIGGRLLRVYDAHDDGTVFKGGSLALRTADLGGAHRDIVLTGIEIRTEGEPDREQAVAYVYRADCAAARLTLVFKTPGASIEIGDSKPALRCPSGR